MAFSNLETQVVILAGGEGTRLWPLTDRRNKPAVPFGGRFRLIDIPLSNAINSHMKSIFVSTQGKDYSFGEHVKHGWDIPELREDEFTTLISPQDPGGKFNGDADSVRQIIDYISRSYITYSERQASRKLPDNHITIVVPGDGVVKMDYRKLANFLAENPDADAAVAYLQSELINAGNLGSLLIGSDNIVEEIKEKDANTPFRVKDDKHFPASIGIYAFRTGKLIESLRETKGNSFSPHILEYFLDNKKLLGYNFSQHNKIPGYIFDQKTGKEVFTEQSPDSDYWEDVGLIETYFAVHMDLVGAEPRFNIHAPVYPEHYKDIRGWWPIRTPVSNSVGPGKTVLGGEISDAIMDSGVILSQTKSHKVVLSPHVYVESSTLDEAIVYSGAIIRNSKLHRTIVDKNAIVEGLTIGYEEPH
ncbi:MAG: sugar phosphate nucleotidyltransferase, partial [Nanoarchaeota archaeon]|nr:sugar phosphate nucleotidyltransferase [Nanoarchaeota archaeon]